MILFEASGLVSEDVITWLKLQATELDQIEMSPGPNVADTPDQLVTVTSVPGPGLGMDGLLDMRAFQLRCRGPQFDHPQAARMSSFVDKVVLQADFPVEVGPYRIVEVRRLGGGPSPVPGTPDSGNRYEYLATYLFTVTTDL